MSTPKARQHRKQSLFQMIEQGLQPGIFVNEEKIIAYFSEIYGTMRRTVLGYLRELELSDKIIRKDGDIWTLKALSEKQELEDLEKLAKENQTQEAVENEKRENNANTGEGSITSNSTS